MICVKSGIAVAVLSAAIALGLSATASADDWLVTKLRGSVLQFEAGDWVPLERGDIVADDRALRTLASGRVELQRGAEVIALGPNTQAEIHDRRGARFTTVEQAAGTVTIEAEVRNVRHFAVETPFLAAVVKGTRFEVITGPTGSSVRVTRGLVAVTDIETGESVDVPAGEVAEVAKDGGLHRDGGLALAEQKSGHAVGAGKEVGADHANVRAEAAGENGSGNGRGNGKSGN